MWKWMRVWTKVGLGVSVQLGVMGEMGLWTLVPSAALAHLGLRPLHAMKPPMQQQLGNHTFHVPRGILKCCENAAKGYSVKGTHGY